MIMESLLRGGLCKLVSGNFKSHEVITSKVVMSMLEK